MGDRGGGVIRGLALAALAGLLAAATPGRALAEPPSMEELNAAIVKVNAYVRGDSRTAATLGTEREGTGTLIGGDGLIVTIGYLILEADRVELTAGGKKVPAEIVGYDHDTGFGLVRALGKIPAKPLKLGDAQQVKVKDRVLAINHNGADNARPALVVSRREFAGYWEYLLASAIFTAPPLMDWSGAALVDQEGRLVGVGSLIVNDPMQGGDIGPGNMFVPIDLLKPVMADLMTQGKPSAPPKPWIGVNSEEVRGRLFVTRVSPGTPADKAGLRKGDIVLGVAGKPVGTLAEFYRALWATGQAGADVKLNVLQGVAPAELTVKSIDRYQWLKMNRSY
ncbi:MAG: S1C family serine protease [Rhodospirillales bacterium]